MANTYVKIASVTVGVLGASTIDFTSIPATYTDLVLKISTRQSVTNGLSGYYYDVTYNNTSANRTGRYLLNLDGSVSSAVYTLWGLSDPSDFTATTFSNGELYIPNYASANNKSASMDSTNENNATGIRQILATGLWSDTAAITSVKLTTGGGNFVQYSTATLYGISKS